MRRQLSRFHPNHSFVLADIEGVNRRKKLLIDDEWQSIKENIEDILLPDRIGLHLLKVCCWSIGVYQGLVLGAKIDLLDHEFWEGFKYDEIAVILQQFISTKITCSINEGKTTMEDVVLPEDIYIMIEEQPVMYLD
jgi:hypothetical protein